MADEPLELCVLVHGMGRSERPGLSSQPRRQCERLGRVAWEPRGPRDPIGALLDLFF